MDSTQKNTKGGARRALVLTVPEAGSLLGLGRAASYNAVARGEIPVIRIGRRLIVPIPAMAELLHGAAPQQCASPGPARTQDSRGSNVAQESTPQ